MNGPTAMMATGPAPPMPVAVLHRKLASAHFTISWMTKLSRTSNLVSGGPSTVFKFVLPHCAF